MEKEKAKSITFSSCPILVILNVRRYWPKTLIKDRTKKILKNTMKMLNHKIQNGLKLLQKGCKRVT